MAYKNLSGFADEISSEIKIQFEVFNKLGINYFEPRGVNGKNISELSDDEVNELLSEMKKHGISASSIGSPIGKIKVTDDFDAHFELFRRVVKTAKSLGTKYIRMFSFYNDAPEWSEDARKCVFERLKVLIDYAKAEGVVLLHENEKDIYGDTIERCLDLFENLACENFRAVFDPANFVQCGIDTKEAFAALRPYIEYMHIKDSLADGTIVPAGDGLGNIPYILGELLTNGYTGYISLEPHLGSFDGLEMLELDDAMMKLPKGGEGTFTLAYNALNKIIERI